MNSEARAYLKKHIEIFLDKFPNSTTWEVYEWIESGSLSMTSLKSTRKLLEILSVTRGKNILSMARYRSILEVMDGQLRSLQG